MPNPSITFRLTPYQLARGLQIVRSLEPGFQLTSLNQLVKIIYTDYLAKMTLGQTDAIDPTTMMEIKNFITNPTKREINLYTLVDHENNLLNLTDSTLTMPIPDEISTSSISTVTDFSPPKDWMDADSVNEEDYKANHFTKE